MFLNYWCGVLAHSFCSVEAEICFSKHVPDLKTCGFEDVFFSNHGPDSCKHGGVLTHSFCFVGGVSVFPTAALTPPPFLNGLPSERWWPQRRVWKSKYSCSTKRNEYVNTKSSCRTVANIKQYTIYARPVGKSASLSAGDHSRRSGWVGLGAVRTRRSVSRIWNLEM